MVRIHPRLQVGLEYNPGADEIGFLGNAILNVESAAEPHLSLGTSSDRIGTPEGFQCYYLTFAKSFGRIGPYVSFNYSEFDQGLNLPFGVAYRLGAGLSAMYMDDGSRSHALLTYSRKDWSATLMWVWFKHPGISLTWGF
jgi:hypothetical protein